MKLKLITFFLCFFSLVPLLAQNIISGTVTDESIQPLPGVNITIKGSNTGVSTDFDGKFEITVEQGQTLKFSFLGFKNQEVTIGSQKSITIMMIEDASALDEIVLIGYGSAKKRDLTGAISSVSSEQLTIRPVQSIGQALQGQASGVLVRTNSAAPGGGTSIVIRGQNSVNSGSSPLYVVDGIPLSNIDNLPVEDIESIEVLKDASSTAIYGSRGANGVILITSKKGKKGKPQISFSTRVTSENLNGNLNLMNGQEFAETFTAWELAQGTNPNNLFYDGSSPNRPLPSSVGEGTDWFNEITRNGFIVNNQISVSGGSDVNRYSASLNYLDHKGVVKNGKYDRAGLRLSNQTNVASWLTTSINLYVTHENNTSSGENTSGEGGSGTINQAVKMSPALPIFNPDGTFTSNNLPGAQGIENPVARVLEETNENRDWDIIGNINFIFKPIKNLTFKTGLGGDFNNFKRTFYNPTTTIVGGLLGGIAQLVNSNRSHFVNENIINYKNTFNEKHNLDVIVGSTYEEQTFENFGTRATGFFTDSFLFNNIGSASNFDRPFSEKTKWQLLSFLGRANYSINSKYLFSVSARYDGSSRFGEGNKWGFFPSLSGAWVVSSEGFMESTKKVINRLKLRGSWARTGNQNIGLQRSLATFDLANYPVGTSIQSGVSASQLANSDLKWETTESINIGIDAKLFNTVDLTLDYYEKTTTDLLLNVGLIETSGFSQGLLNTGELENKGFEFTANVKILDNEDFKVNISTNFFTNKNKIIALEGDATQDWKIGQPLGIRRSYLSGGIIRNEADLDAYRDENGNPINGLGLGDFRAVDLNGDGIIGGDDLTVIFDPNPDFTYSFNTNFNYKNLSLDLFFYGSEGNQIWNLNSIYINNVGIIRTNLNKNLVNNYWTPDNPNARYPRLANQSPQSFSNQEYVVEDGSFLKLQNIRLGYKLPEFLMFKSASIYCSAQNIFTITGYSGFDPDVNSTPGNNSTGVDRNSYPIPSSITLGAQFNF